MDTSLSTTSTNFPLDTVPADPSLAGASIHSVPARFISSWTNFRHSSRSWCGHLERKNRRTPSRTLSRCGNSTANDTFSSATSAMNWFRIASTAIDSAPPARSNAEHTNSATSVVRSFVQNSGSVASCPTSDQNAASVAVVASLAATVSVSEVASSRRARGASISCSSTCSPSKSCRHDTASRPKM